jgi:ZIP family zinc transporter
VVEASNVIVLGFVASLFASAGTAVGSLGVLFISSLSRKLEDGLLSVAVSSASALMPWALAFSAGAMLFVISDEIIPETHSADNKNLATFSLLGGFVIMMILDAVIG